MGFNPFRRSNSKQVKQTWEEHEAELILLGGAGKALLSFELALGHLQVYNNNRLSPNIISASDNTINRLKTKLDNALSQLETAKKFDKDIINRSIKVEEGIGRLIKKKIKGLITAGKPGDKNRMYDENRKILAITQHDVEDEYGIEHALDDIIERVKRLGGYINDKTYRDRLHPNEKVDCGTARSELNRIMSAVKKLIEIEKQVEKELKKLKE